jgi:hypothetical protein
MAKLVAGSSFPAAIRTTLMTRIAPTLIAVVQFCMSALRRVPTALITASAAIIATATAFAATGDRSTNSRRYAVKATARVATVAVPITRKSAQPYRKARKPPNASRMKT